ncbi:MAG TPA: biotin/lipoyl-containing protein [Longimicrobiaceae bacterium]|nr:biotin/lipoyl-containing protein [Longimicrobiaceae bacterium]
MRYFVTLNDRTFEVDLSGATPSIDGEPVEADLATVPGTGLRSLRLDGRSYPLLARRGERAGKWEVTLHTRRLALDVVDERTRAIREMTGGAEEEAEKTVTAPMPGLVVRVEVEVGDAVTAGQGVAVVEAMKMENELKAPADGVVTRVEVQPGQTVDRGAVLIVLE